MSGLSFDVDLEQMEALAERLELEAPEVRAAMSRAIKRTRGTLRADSARGLKSRLGLRTTTRLRRRIKVRWSRKNEEIELWYGLNDFPVRDFTGQPQATAGGVAFREHQFSKAFIGRPLSSAPKGVWRRLGKGRFPIEEVSVPVADEMSVFIEDVVFERAGELLLDYFEHEIVARGIFGVGR